MAASADPDGSGDLATTAVALGVLLLGVGVLGGLVVVELTGGVTQADYAAFQASCADLSNESVLTDAGVGLRRAPLNESAAAVCRNTTVAEYRAARLRSMSRAPLNARQWGLYGGAGLLFLLGGASLLQQELARWN